MTLQNTIGKALDDAAWRLKAAGVVSSRLDARLLLAEAAGLDAASVFCHPERSLRADELSRFEGFLVRREAREPLARILGRREFWSLSFVVNEATLVPRPDSETVLEAALSGVTDRKAPYRLLDLGTGTGCLLLALLFELPRATGLGSDISEAALAIAKENAARLGFEGRAQFTQADWTDGLEGSFDIVVSNPPYISERDMDSLMPDVARFEPHNALSPGPEGLEAYRQIIPRLPGLLNPGGLVCFEVGQGQAKDVAQILEECGFQVAGVKSDLAGIERCVSAFWRPCDK